MAGERCFACAGLFWAGGAHPWDGMWEMGAPELFCSSAEGQRGGTGTPILLNQGKELLPYWADGETGEDSP